MFTTLFTRSSQHPTQRLWNSLSISSQEAGRNWKACHDVQLLGTSSFHNFTKMQMASQAIMNPCVAQNSLHSKTSLIFQLEECLNTICVFCWWESIEHFTSWLKRMPQSATARVILTTATFRYFLCFLQWRFGSSSKLFEMLLSEEADSDIPSFFRVLFSQSYWTIYCHGICCLT